MRAMETARLVELAEAAVLSTGKIEFDACHPEVLKSLGTHRS